MVAQLLYSLLHRRDFVGLLAVLYVPTLGLLLGLQDPHPQVLDLGLFQTGSLFKLHGVFFEQYVVKGLIE